MNSLKILFMVFSIVSCTYKNESKILQEKLKVKLADTNATFNTVALFYNIKNLSENRIMFGHHHSTEYGIGWKWEKNRSDVKDVTGSFPGLIGWDFLDVMSGMPDKTQHLIELITEAHNLGIINTFAWHNNNLVTGNNFYDTTMVVKHIIPGGDFNKEYVKQLDTIAQFVKHLVGRDGRVIPIIFRPYHEFDGNWFWWGKHFCSKEEFITLWQFTLDYLRNVRHVENILYAFSPDRNFENEEEFLERYPGDQYVDIVGMDNYWDFLPEGEGLSAVSKKLKIITKIALKKNKIAAFTETGSEKIPEDHWWTEKLLKVMDDDSIKIAYVMVWRNADLTHFYAPYFGHSSSENFIEFKNNPKIIFADKLPALFNVNINLSK